MPFAAVLMAFPLPSLAAGPSMPLYLLTDVRYMLFVTVYVLLTVLCVMFALSRAKKRDEQKPFDLARVSLGASFVMMLGLLYQMVHHLEHVSQIFQYWYLGLRPGFSKGLLFFLDLEWNHFIFDSGYFFLMGFAAWAFAAMWRAGGKALGWFGGGLLLTGFLTQGWHAVEHTVRLTRHISEGCDPCRGLVDAWTGWHLIPLHFWYNVFALTIPLMAFFYFRMDRKILEEARRLLSRAKSA